MVNESPKVALMSKSNSIDSERPEMTDWDRMAAENSRAILSGVVDPSQFMSKRESKEDPIPDDVDEHDEEEAEKEAPKPVQAPQTQKPVE